ncbi:unnamed protein product, partial [Onchocerca ochengi]|uniref:CFA20_dom domain-containing protein n=1 Tax=Onchocerca ochengi TaxID=42157 RepID=A0A182EWC8_ONCOC
MPMRLDEGWNQIQFNLADFTKRAYGTAYVETLRIQIHANCRIRRIYFADRLYSEDELPAEFKLYLPIKSGAQGTGSSPTSDDDPIVATNIGMLYNHMRDHENNKIIEVSKMLELNVKQSGISKRVLNVLYRKTKSGKVVK